MAVCVLITFLSLASSQERVQRKPLPRGDEAMPYHL